MASKDSKGPTPRTTLPLASIDATRGSALSLNPFAPLVSDALPRSNSSAPRRNEARRNRIQPGFADTGLALYPHGAAGGTVFPGTPPTRKH